MMRWIVRSSLHFRFIVVALAVGMVAFGATRVSNMPVDVFPEFAPPFVEVQTEGLGMSTEEVETLITIPMEQALNSTPGLDTMRSTTVPGLSAITLIFDRGTDPLEARQLVNERVATAIPSLPASAGIPWTLQPLSATSRAMKIGLTLRPLRPDRPLDDRVLDDALAADGGSGRRERRHLGRPLEAAPVPDGPGQARGPQHDDRRRDVGRLGRARLRAPEVHGRRQEPGRRLHRDPQPAARHPSRAAGVHAAAACERHRVGQAERRRIAARARRPRDDGVGPPAAVRRRRDQRPPGPAHGGREVPVGQHARRDPRGRPGARPDAARPAGDPHGQPHLPAGRVHRDLDLESDRRAASRDAARGPRPHRVPLRVAGCGHQPGRDPALADGSRARALRHRRDRSTRWCSRGS